MTHFLIITFIVAARIFRISSTQATCGPDEVERDPMTDCKSDCCPVPECQTSACTDPCSLPCKCASLQDVYAQNGTCIPARECPAIPCGDNEEFTPCPNTFCSELCSNAQPPTANGQRCRNIGLRPGPVVICRPACTCKLGYFRDDNNKCVYYTECPKCQGNCDYS